MCCIEQRATNATASVLRVYKQQVHFPFWRVNCGETDNLIRMVYHHEQSVRRSVRGYNIVPFLRRKHWFTGKLAKIFPPGGNSCVEHLTDPAAISRNGTSNSHQSYIVAPD